jgi:hypothetical protein
MSPPLNTLKGDLLPMFCSGESVCVCVCVRMCGELHRPSRCSGDATAVQRKWAAEMRVTRAAACAVLFLHKDEGNKGRGVCRPLPVLVAFMLLQRRNIGAAGLAWRLLKETMRTQLHAVKGGSSGTCPSLALPCACVAAR